MTSSLINYYVALSISEKLLNCRIIDENDLVKIEKELALKYGVKDNSIYSEKDLINMRVRANIHVRKVSSNDTKNNRNTS